MFQQLLHIFKTCAGGAGFPVVGSFVAPVGGRQSMLKGRSIDPPRVRGGLLPN